jgi:hypothetical protein
LYKKGRCVLPSPTTLLPPLATLTYARQPQSKQRRPSQIQSRHHPSRTVRLHPFRSYICASSHRRAWLDLRGGVDKTIGLIKNASSQGAKIIGFPELFIPGAVPFASHSPAVGLEPDPVRPYLRISLDSLGQHFPGVAGCTSQVPSQFSGSTFARDGRDQGGRQIGRLVGRVGIFRARWRFSLYCKSRRTSYLDFVF